MTMTFRITLLAASLAATAAIAQPDRPPPPPTGERAPAWDDDPLDPLDLDEPGPRMREFVQRRLDRSTKEQEALRTALDMLDRGEPAEKVREHLRATLGEEMRQRAQNFREMRRRQGGPGGPGGPDGPGGPGGGPRDDAPPPRPGPGELEGPGARGGPPGAPRPFEQLLAVLRETNPEMADRLERVRRENPDRFRRLIDEYAPRLARLAEERERFPERWPDRVRLFQLQQEAGKTAREAATATDDRRGEATERLRGLVAQMHEIRLKFASQDLERNREQARRLEKDIEEKSRDSAALIDRQVEDMLRRESERRPGERRPPREHEPAGDPPSPAVF